VLQQIGICLQGAIREEKAMALMKWDDSLSANVVEIDRQHQELVSISKRSMRNTVLFSTRKAFASPPK
jgi:hypothetical protein